MDIKTIIILILLCVILYLVKKITHIKKKEIDRIREVLVDIKDGDYNRRILIKKK